jgi:4-amino-4-deoxy-L-arabinose transferase-like glycosyltransferase
MVRPLDAGVVAAVHRFTRRRRWLHILAILAGIVLLVLGSAIIAARVTGHAPAKLPGMAEGLALYVAGAVLVAFGAARGLTARLAIWLPASLVLGVLVILVLALVALFPGTVDELERPGSSSSQGALGPSPDMAPSADGALAVEVYGRSDVERYLGPDATEAQTPGLALTRRSSLARWRTKGVRPTASPSLTLILQYRPGQAARGGMGTPIPGNAPYARVRRREFAGMMTTYVRDHRAPWVVSLQLRDAGRTDPTPELARDVTQILDLLHQCDGRLPVRLRWPGDTPARRWSR